MWLLVTFQSTNTQLYNFPTLVCRIKTYTKKKRGGRNVWHHDPYFDDRSPQLNIHTLRNLQTLSCTLKIRALLQEIVFFCSRFKIYTISQCSHAGPNPKPFLYTSEIPERGSQTTLLHYFQQQCTHLYIALFTRNKKKLSCASMNKYEITSVQFLISEEIIRYTIGKNKTNQRQRTQPWPRRQSRPSDQYKCHFW